MASSHLASREPGHYGQYTTDLPALLGSFLKSRWTRRWYLLCCGKASQLLPAFCLILPFWSQGSLSCLCLARAVPQRAGRQW